MSDGIVAPVVEVIRAGRLTRSSRTTIVNRMGLESRDRAAPVC